MSLRSRRIKVITPLLLMADTGFADERWEEFWNCQRSVLDNVEIAEPAIWDGAELIVNALCVSVATDLANDMVNNRDYFRSSQSFGDAFNSALYVVIRETAIDLYNKRVLRMGLEEIK